MHENEFQEKVLHELHECSFYLRTILRLYAKELSSPTTIHIRFEGATMPVTLSVGQSVTATASESNALTPIIPIIAADLSWTTSDPTIATATTNLDGTASYKAIAPGTATVTVTDSKFTLTKTETITVDLAVVVPTEIAITFGTPV